MGTITVVISDELEREIRLFLSREGRIKKGALSKLVEDALWAYIKPRIYSSARVFRAVKNGKVVAEAHTLSELAEKLRNLGVDPREVRIFSSSRIKFERKIGLRGSRL